MKAVSLICGRAGDFSLEEVNLPDPGRNSVVVRTRYSGVSTGTETALISGKITWGPYPLCTGYMAVGEVEYAGPGVSGLKAGDIVYYRDNSAMMRVRDGAAVSPVAGTHCSHAVIDAGKTEGLAKLPAGADEKAAASFVLPAVGLNGVDQSGPRMGWNALVYGCGPIGLGVVFALFCRGCAVTAADVDAGRLELAKAFGAARTVNVKSGAGKVADGLPDGYDIVYECTGKSELLASTMSFCRRHGHFVWQGNYGDTPFPYEFMPGHMRMLTMHFPCNDGLEPCRDAVLRQMAAGVLPWGKAISHVVPYEQAPDFYSRLTGGGVEGLCVAVVDWRGFGRAG